VFITLDTNLRYQQNLAGRFPATVAVLDRIQPGEIIQVGSTD
jgi:hypothetical protein